MNEINGNGKSEVGLQQLQRSVIFLRRGLAKGQLPIKSCYLRGCDLTFGMASLSPFSGTSSESEQACPSLKASRGLRRGRWCSGWKVNWVLSKLLTARRVLQVFGGREGSASRSEISPCASPITAMSTVTLVPEDWTRETGSGRKAEVELNAQVAGEEETKGGERKSNVSSSAPQW